jgi:predicted CXXCH cytochrome family protein
MVNVMKKGMLLCAALFLPMLCVAGTRSAQALVEAKAPDASMKGAKYVGTETCATCHEEEGRMFKLSPHGRLTTKKADENTAQGCEICHGPGSIHADNGGGKMGIINPKKDPDICFSCHMEKKMEFRLPNHHPVLEGKMSCVDCHELHGPDASPSGTAMESQVEMCTKCHKDQAGPFVFEHDALKEGCTVCHKVHGSINEKMLVARDANLCMRCHTQPNYGTGIIGSGGGHNSRLQGGTCYSAGCHTDLHGSNYEPSLRY